MAKIKAHVRHIHYLMGCFMEIEASGEYREALRDTVQAAFQEMRRIESLLSKFLPDSLISFLNQFASVAPVPIPLEIFNLFQLCVHYSARTQGAFDITVAPLIDLWHSAAKRNQIPSQSEIREVSRSVGYRHLILNEERKTIFFARAGMKIDFGAVGKGYAIDRAAAILREGQVEHAVISAGSSIFRLGKSELWFGISDPFRPSKIITAVPLQNNALSTSANFEQFLSIEGKTFGHLIHPVTGYPESNGLASVTITANSAAVCDILSTATFLLGKEEGPRFIKNLADVKAVLILSPKSRLSPELVQI